MVPRYLDEHSHAGWPALKAGHATYAHLWSNVCARGFQAGEPEKPGLQSHLRRPKELAGQAMVEHAPE